MYAPLNATVAGSLSTRTSAAVTSSVAIDSQCVMPRCAGLINKSISRIAQVAPSRKSSGSSTIRSWTLKFIVWSVSVWRASIFGDEQVVDELADRGIHQVRQRCRPDAEQQR